MNFEYILDDMSSVMRHYHPYMGTTNLNHCVNKVLNAYLITHARLHNPNKDQALNDIVQKYIRELKPNLYEIKQRIKDEILLLNMDKLL